MGDLSCSLVDVPPSQQKALHYAACSEGVSLRSRQRIKKRRPITGLQSPNPRLLAAATRAEELMMYEN
jgi:hypothetical protein